MPGSEHDPAIPGEGVPALPNHRIIYLGWKRPLRSSSPSIKQGNGNRRWSYSSGDKVRKELPLDRQQDRQDGAEGGLSSTTTLCPLPLATAPTFPLLGWPLSNVSTALTFTLSLVQHSGFSVPKNSGKAEAGSSCSGKGGLESFPCWAVPCCPAGEQILVWN